MVLQYAANAGGAEKLPCGVGEAENRRALR